MKKIIFVLMIIVSTIFVSCDAPTEVKVVEVSTSKTESVTFTDFFNPVELVHSSSDNISTAIVMDKNTGVGTGYPVSYKGAVAPGSTFKVLMAVSLIDHDIFYKNTVFVDLFDCNMFIACDSCRIPGNIKVFFSGHLIVFIIRILIEIILNLFSMEMKNIILKG